MTKEGAVKHWKFIEGFKNGREIELYDHGFEEWREIINTSFDIDREYRFKQEPKYIPFDFSDAQKLIGKIIKDDTLLLHMIVSIDHDGVVFYDDHFSFKELFELFRFHDGSICGKLCQ